MVKALAKKRDWWRRPCVERLEGRIVLSASAGATLLVQLAPQVNPLVADQLAAAGGATAQATGVPGLVAIRGSAAGLAAVSAAAAGNPSVAFVEPQQIEHPTAVPNDPDFTAGNLWGLNGTNGIQAPAAWNTTTGSPATVTIADIDSGVDYDAPDIYQSIWINQPEIPASRMKNLVDVYHDGYISWHDLNNPINQGPGKITDVNGDGVIDAGDILAPMILNPDGTDSGRGGWANPNNTQDGDTAHPDDLIGWNFVANNNNPFDDLGHGTETVGPMAATGNNGVGMTGVNWSAQVMVLKFIDSSGNGTNSEAAAAILYAAAHGARVANASWGANGTSQVLHDAIVTAGNEGMVLVAAAGNDGTSNDSSPFFPAAFDLPNEISVAATDQNGQLASFSNFGPQTVDLGAPGVGIETTLVGGTYGTIQGTSVAAPFVTGTVALVAGLHPTWTAVELVEQVENTVTPDSALAGSTVTGGILDAAAAVGPVAIPLPPTITWPSPASIVYGTPLGATQLDAMASVSGTYTYTPAAGTILGAGNGQVLSVTFVPDDTKDYTTVVATTMISVLKAAPTINWATPAAIVYGIPLGTTQLSATATLGSMTVPGLMTYTPALGTILKVGAGQTLSVAFTPSDHNDFTSATDSVTINVLKATPVLTWPNPSDIVYGTPLGSNQLDATASFLGSVLAGTFVYTPAMGTVLHAAAGQLLSAVFTASDTADFNPATVTTTINVQKATPAITWPTPSGITYGAALGAAQLDASTAIAGSFAYTPASGVVPVAGSRTLSAVFTPTDGADYNAAVVLNTINVAKAHLTVTADNKSRVRGFVNPPLTYTLSGFVNGDTASVVTGSASLSTTAAPASKDGVCSIVVAPGTLSALNYDFPNLINGTLTITGSSAAQADDFDGDGKSDMAVFRPSTDQWIVSLSGGGSLITAFGDPAFGDVPVPADYEGIGKDDLAVFRPSTDQWIIRLSNGSTIVKAFGDPSQHDIPVPGDYEGNGKADLAVYRPSTGQWIIQLSNGTTVVKAFGDPTQHDIPVPGDYFGTGTLDLAVFRPSTDQWIIQNPAGGTSVIAFGDPSKHDQPIPGDYNGDNKTDLAVFRPSTDQWILMLPTGTVVTSFGDTKAGDVAAWPMSGPIIKPVAPAVKKAAVVTSSPPPLKAAVIFAAPVTADDSTTTRKKA